MRPIKFTIFELFQMQKQYMVPIFQRPYVWGAERQWDPLWKDIIAKAEEVSQHSSPPYQIRKHFLGAVVTNQIQIFGHHIAASDVIDGQQRLTTLQILLYALRDYADAESYATSELKFVTENIAGLGGPTEKYKVWPTTGDRAVYEHIAQLGSPVQLEAIYPLEKIKYTKRFSPRPRLVEAYLFFYEAIRIFCIDPAASSQKRFDGLVAAVTKHLEIVAIELETGDDPQVIFETLNARGEPLLPSDLIRNFVFLEATRQQQDVDKLYQKYWSEFDGGENHDLFWEQEQTQGRFKRPQLDLFIFHYLTSRTQRDIPIKHIYIEFRDWWSKNCPDVQVGLQELQTASQQYRILIEPQGQSRLSVFCDRLRVLDVGPVYPVLLLLTIHQKQKVASGELPGILTDLESYLVRRMVCEFTPKNYNNNFVQVLKKLDQATTIDRALFRSILRGFQGESGEWPTNQQFKQAWITKPIYERLSAQRVLLLLKALDLQQITTKQEQIHLIGDLSVEHVMPQKWSLGDWPFYDGEAINLTPDEAQVEDRKRLIHSLGNLTILTKPLNASVSNGPFVSKKPEITLQASSRLNAYFQMFNPADAWNEETIRQRSESLFQTALQIWPYP